MHSAPGWETILKVDVTNAHLPQNVVRAKYRTSNWVGNNQFEPDPCSNWSGPNAKDELSNADPAGHPLAVGGVGKLPKTHVRDSASTCFSSKSNIVRPTV